MELEKATDQEILQEIYKRNKRGTIFSLRLATNGWIAESVDAEGVAVVAEDDDTDSHTAFMNFLNRIIMDHGPTCNKYSEKRVLAITYPGLDYEGPLSDGYREYLTDLRRRLDRALTKNA